VRQKYYNAAGLLTGGNSYKVLLTSVQENLPDRMIPVFFGFVLGNGSPIEIPEAGFIGAAMIGDFAIAFVSGVRKYYYANLHKGF